MRISAGVHKGRRLVTPRGDVTRPTADQVRIALMDTLMPWLPGARVLALFAGVLRAFRTRRFGETTLTFFRAGGYDAPSQSPSQRG